MSYGLCINGKVTDVADDAVYFDGDSYVSIAGNTNKKTKFPNIKYVNNNILTHSVKINGKDFFNVFNSTIRVVTLKRKYPYNLNGYLFDLSYGEYLLAVTVDNPIKDTISDAGLYTYGVQLYHRVMDNDGEFYENEITFYQKDNSIYYESYMNWRVDITIHFHIIKFNMNVSNMPYGCIINNKIISPSAKQMRLIRHDVRYNKVININNYSILAIYHCYGSVKHRTIELANSTIIFREFNNKEKNFHSASDIIFDVKPKIMHFSSGEEYVYKILLLEK